MRGWSIATRVLVAASILGLMVGGYDYVRVAWRLAGATISGEFDSKPACQSVLDNPKSRYAVLGYDCVSLANGRWIFMQPAHLARPPEIYDGGRAAAYAIAVYVVLTVAILSRRALNRAPPGC